MAELKDSGARRDFGTGAVRDVADGKGRCDLLPLKVVERIVAKGRGNSIDAILDSVNAYVLYGNVEYLEAAIAEFAIEQCGNVFTAMLEAAKQYEDGCQKYGERNWENGIPLHCYIDSGVRHYLKFLRGDTDEPHDRAFIWNMLGAIWTHENKPELIDLPFADIANPITDKPVEPWGEEDDRRQDILICNTTKCSECVFPNTARLDGFAYCVEWCEAHPAEARKIMDEMEGRNHA